MSAECCDGDAQAAQRKPPRAVRTRACPECGHRAQAVGYLTLLHQLRTPLNQSLAEQPYWFCADPGCRVVYFGRDGAAYGATELREPVLQKSADPDRLVCHCFGISVSRVEEEIAERGASASRQFVAEQTRRGNCACELRNPSGKCCLRDFPPPASGR